MQPGAPSSSSAEKVLPGRLIRIIFFGRWGWVFFDKTDNDFCMNGVTLHKKFPLYYFLRVL